MRIEAFCKCQWLSIGAWSVDREEQVLLLLLGSYREGFFNDLLGDHAALAALGHNAKLLADFAQAGGATKDGVFDLVVGDTFAETDVHVKLPVKTCINAMAKMYSK